MKPSLDRLALMQTFVRIVEAGSLSAAALQMNATQPTISRRLKALEASLGLTLLHRTTHAMTLTEAGARYFERAKDLLAAWGEFESGLRGVIDEPQGMLRVVAPHAFGQHHLVGPLSEYLERYPKVSVEWLLHDAPLNFVEQGVDCAIRVGAISDLSVVALKLAEVPRIVVGSPALLGGHPTPRTPDDLAGLPWLALRPFYRNEVTLRDADGAEASIAIQPRIASDSLYAIRSALLRDVGIAVVSAWVVEDELKRGALVQLAPNWEAPPLPVYLMYPYAAHYPAKLRSFVDFMRHAMDVLPGAERSCRSRSVDGRPTSPSSRLSEPK